MATPLPMPVSSSLRAHHALEDLAAAVESVGGFEQLDHLDEGFGLVCACSRNVMAFGLSSSESLMARSDKNATLVKARG